MNEWLNANYIHIIAVAAGIAIRWAAMRFLAEAKRSSSRSRKGGGTFDGAGGGGRSGGKWNKDRVIKFMTLFFVFCAGLILAYGLYPLALWIIGWGEGLGGVIAIIFGVATLAAGWHSMYGMVALIHDMTDGTPDDEAFSAGFLVPTTIPLGWAALSALFANPRGAGTGWAVVAVSAVTVIYAHKILKRVYAAQGHERLWMWFGFAVSIFVGIVHIAALAYLNQMAGEYLPEWLAWTIRAGMVIAGVVLLVVGLADIFDWTPEQWSHRAAMYTIPTFTVLAASLATMQANAADQLDTVFGVFR